MKPFNRDDVQLDKRSSLLTEAKQQGYNDSQGKVVEFLKYQTTLYDKWNFVGFLLWLFDRHM